MSDDVQAPATDNTNTGAAAAPDNSGTNQATDQGQNQGAPNTDAGTQNQPGQNTAPTDQGNQGDKGGEQPAGAPEKYDFSIPEGMQVDEALMSQFEGLARESNLSNEQANKIAGIYAERMQAAEKANAEAWKQLQDKWVGDLRNDSDVGGQNFNANMEIAKDAVNKFGGEELSTALKELGVDNHPLLVKAFVKIGKAIQEDSFVSPGQQGSSKTAQSLYPNSNMNP